ncbi:MAG: P-loop NTPase [Oscillospiraceae bacterium]|nr:P-loop NTPase [Oscillospiraceae bacterium]
MSLTIAVVSGKGGAGKSTCTASLAHAFTSLGKRVLVIDCDIGLRSLDMLLGFSKELVFTWGDVLRNGCTLNQALLTRGNLSLLAAPLYPTDSFTTVVFELFMRNLRELWDVILLDAPAGFASGFYLASGSADMALVISQPESVSARAAAACVRELKAAYPQMPARLLINRLYKKRVQGGVLLNIDETIDAVNAQLLGIIPEESAVAATIGHGKPLPETSSGAKSFLRVARRLQGEEVALEFK